MPQRIAGRGELGREPLERRDRALGGGDQVGRALALVGRERVAAADAAARELGHVAKPLALGAQLVLPAGLETARCRLDERPQLVEPRLGGGRVAGQLVVGAAGGGELAPGARAPRARCPAPAKASSTPSW